MIETSPRSHEEQSVPTEATEIHDVKPDENLVENQDPSFVEGLSTTDQEIVVGGAETQTRHFQTNIGRLDAITSHLEAAPDRIRIISGKLVHERLQLIADKARQAMSSEEAFVRFDPEVKACVEQVWSLQADVRRAGSGAKFSRAELATKGVQVPRLTIGSKRRILVEAQLRTKLTQAQSEAMDQASSEPADYDLMARRTAALATRVVASEDAAAYAYGQTEDLPGIAEDAGRIHVDQQTLVAVAIGTFDNRKFTEQYEQNVDKELTAKVRSRAFEQFEKVDVRSVYSDHTLAGQVARQHIAESGADQRMVEAYKRVLTARGNSPDQVNVAAVQLQTDWVARANHAAEKFDVSTLAGDTVLEHYTALAVDVMRSGGLRPKSQHGRTAINHRSQQVHFTSRGGEAGNGQSLDYTLYGNVNGAVATRLAEDADAVAVSGVFAIPLAEAVRGGLSCAGFTTKRLDGKNYPNDIILARADGTEASISLEDMDFVPRRFAGEFAQNPRFVYDHAVRSRAKGLRQADDQAGVAKEVLGKAGVDQAWAEMHVFADVDELRRSPRLVGLRDSTIVPLSLTHGISMKGEHVDGDGSTLQQVILGVSEHTPLARVAVH